MSPFNKGHADRVDVRDEEQIIPDVTNAEDSTRRYADIENAYDAFGNPDIPIEMPIWSWVAVGAAMIIIISFVALYPHGH